MIKIHRYEVITWHQKPAFYDRLTHEITVSFSENNALIPFCKQDCSMVSLYPYRFLRGIKIPRLLLAIYCLMAFVCFGLVTPLVLSVRAQLAIERLFPSIVLLPVLLFGSVFLHELSHAIVGTGTGGIVCEICAKRNRFGLSFFTILFWEKYTRYGRFLYFIAGISMNLWLASLGLIAFFLVNGMVYWYLYVLNVLFALLNLFPSKKRNSDGYHLIEILTVQFREK